MSYSTKQATDERAVDVYNALNTRDSEALYTLASLYKEEGDDEVAEDLLKQAKEIDNEDRNQDVRHERAERDAEYTEAHFVPSEL